MSVLKIEDIYTGSCGGYPKCECSAATKVMPPIGGYDYCACGHTLQVHAKRETEPVEVAAPAA